MSDNLRLYNAVRNVPQNAKKPIQAGRLKGYTDINPMWRIKTLTEQFGMCGVGWYVKINDKWLEQGADGQVMAFCEVTLFIKDGDNWSAPIFGVGGAAAVAKEKNGLYTDDECFKKGVHRRYLRIVQNVGNWCGCVLGQRH